MLSLSLGEHEAARLIGMLYPWQMQLVELLIQETKYIAILGGRRYGKRFLSETIIRALTAEGTSRTDAALAVIMPTKEELWPAPTPLILHT